MICTKFPLPLWGFVQDVLLRRPIPMVQRIVTSIRKGYAQNPDYPVPFKSGCISLVIVIQ